MSVILGVNCMSHDTSACLMIDGQVVSMVEEERLNRQKHTDQFPYSAIKSCLSIAGVTYEDVNIVSYSHKSPQTSFLQDKFRAPTIENAIDIKWWLELFDKSGKAHQLFDNIHNLIYAGHHESHAASAFFVSPFDQAVILTIDGAGDDLSTLLAVGHDNRIEIVKEIKYPHSLGRLWEVITFFLGFQGNSDEGKVMALASFGDPRGFELQFKELINVTDEGFFSLNLDFFNFHQSSGDYFPQKMIDLLGPPRDKESHITQAHKDIAATLQQITERILINLVEYMVTSTGIRNVCLAGGVALNCVANSKILSETSAESLFVQPAAGDSGTSLGAAFWAYHSVLNNKRSWFMNNAYLGPGIDQKDVARLLSRTKLPYFYSNSPSLLAAHLINKGRIVGWVQGRSEIGPRALGNRSILCSPATSSIKDYLNSMVKGREPFRPFAPIVLRDSANTFFDIQSRNFAYDYMLSAVKVIPAYQLQIPAVVHVDGTARVQIVDDNSNSLLSDILIETGKLTNIPVLLNTSFNLAGEPIVQSAIDAIRTFSSSGMDDLIIDCYWLTKHLNSAGEFHGFSQSVQ